MLLRQANGVLKQQGMLKLSSREVDDDDVQLSARERVAVSRVVDDNGLLNDRGWSRGRNAVCVGTGWGGELTRCRRWMYGC